MYYLQSHIGDKVMMINSFQWDWDELYRGDKAHPDPTGDD